jgi:hypothetical protein
MTARLLAHKAATAATPALTPMVCFGSPRDITGPILLPTSSAALQVTELALPMDVGFF